MTPELGRSFHEWQHGFWSNKTFITFFKRKIALWEYNLNPFIMKQKISLNFFLVLGLGNFTDGFAKREGKAKTWQKNENVLKRYANGHLCPSYSYSLYDIFMDKIIYSKIQSHIWLKYTLVRESRKKKLITFQCIACLFKKSGETRVTIN